jgi:hypothetical protein
MYAFSLVAVLLVCSVSVSALLSSRISSRSSVSGRKSSLAMSLMEALPSAMSKAMMFLSDTSISEEEILDVTGRVSDLPDPIYVVAFAAVVVIGTGVLQFSLGDLTKEVRE